MKILIIQLARLGDIYISWPTVRALKRAHPEAKITMLTRTKFKEATAGLEALDYVEILSSREIMEPLIADDANIQESFSRMKAFVQKLEAAKYDLIINLSFSPASSWICRLLDPESKKTKGYSRTSDGFLSIPDDMSAYFYAQVGPGRPNRFHLAEIFGTIAGVDLLEPDWSAPALPTFKMPRSGPFVAMHIGASESHKTLSPQKWASIINQFRALSSVPVVLIGGTAERELAAAIENAVSGSQLINLVGLTTLKESISVIQQAQLLVGGDSAPMHMASLTGTRCLNLSIARVNFWETGPRAAGSWILRAATEVDLASDRVAQAMAQMLENKRAPLGTILVQPGTPSYTGLFSRDVEFIWKFVQAIYQGTPFPTPVSEAFWEAHHQLLDVNSFLIDQLRAVQAGAELQDRAPLIERGEEVLGALAKVVPAWAPAIAWYQTEKIRIGPGAPDAILARTLHIQELMQALLEVYSEMKQVQQELAAVEAV